jgi:hypothetical protein
MKEKNKNMTKLEQWVRQVLVVSQAKVLLSMILAIYLRT